MKILIVGYPYIRENYFRTFDYIPSDTDVFFLLPKIWKVKMGKVYYHPPQKSNVYTTIALFNHSGYPLIGGALKGWMPLFLFKIFKFKKMGVEMVYICSEPNLLTTLYFNFWARMAGLKIVNFTWENVDPRIKFKGLKGWLQIFTLKLNLILADGIICGNKKSQVIINKMILKPTAQIPMSGIDCDYFKRLNINKEISGINLSNKIVFTFIGAIGKRKGLDILAEAFAGLLNKVQNSFLVLVGSGEYEEKLKTKVRELNIEKSVLFIPWADHEDLRRILSVSDVFLYPSISYGGWEEQFGYSMVEASLMELPIISTRTGSIEEVVKDGETGILINENNVNDLENAMIKLANNSELSRKLGSAGREFIKQNYSHSIVAKKFNSFFKILLLS